MGRPKVSHTDDGQTCHNAVPWPGLEDLQCQVSHWQLESVGVPDLLEHHAVVHAVVADQVLGGQHCVGVENLRDHLVIPFTPLAKPSKLKYQASPPQNRGGKLQLIS